jgi:hypothetical protein
MGLAERCLDPEEAVRLEVLTAAVEETEDTAPGAGGYWAEAFQRLVGTLRLRRAMRDELAPPGAVARAADEPPAATPHTGATQPASVPRQGIRPGGG